jgi:SAM-dependent methyltransferase
MTSREGSRGNFDAMYAGTPPWDIGRPQPAFARLAETGSITGSVLDVGCGTGEHALMAAKLGLEATGVDLSPTAIERAKRKTEARGLQATFLVHDALHLGALGRTFDTILDSGVFHVFDDHDRAAYVESLRAAIAPGGRYFMLCFSDLVPGDFGPRRVRQDEIKAAFAAGWRVLSIEPATMDVLFSSAGISAWQAEIEPVDEEQASPR